MNKRGTHSAAQTDTLGEGTKMSQAHQYPVPDGWAKKAFIDKAEYDEMYRRSIDDPDAFWGEHGKRIDWMKAYSKVKNTTFASPDVSIKWFEDGTLNVSANCIDRHLTTRGDQTAIIWEGDDPADDKTITYRELHEHVCKLAKPGGRSSSTRRARGAPSPCWKTLPRLALSIDFTSRGSPIRATRSPRCATCGSRRCCRC